MVEARQRLMGFLLRHGRSYDRMLWRLTGGTAWTCTAGRLSRWIKPVRDSGMPLRSCTRNEFELSGLSCRIGKPK